MPQSVHAAQSQVKPQSRPEWQSTGVSQMQKSNPNELSNQLDAPEINTSDLSAINPSATSPLLSEEEREIGPLGPLKSLDDIEANFPVENTSRTQSGVGIAASSDDGSANLFFAKSDGDDCLAKESTANDLPEES